MPDASRLLSELQLCAGLPDAIHRVPFVDYLLTTTPNRPGPVPGRSQKEIPS
jgi:hypothetical protein